MWTTLAASASSCLNLVLTAIPVWAPPQDERDLELALAVAQWLEHVAIEEDRTTSWPVQVEGERRISLDLYSGVPGIVLFFLEAHHVTGRQEFSARARGGADFLLRGIAGEDAPTEVGLYTGWAGIGYTLTEAWKATGDERYRKGAERCLEVLRSSAVEGAGGVSWNTSTDVVYGSAGVGLFLLYAARELDDARALELARRAGARLVESADPDQGGLQWPMTSESERILPNFSHGTAGVGAFLVQLYEATGEKPFLATAIGAGNYLRAIAKETRGGALVFHSKPNNEDLFYLGWCHGPPGTVRFLRALEHVTGDETWRTVADELVGALAASEPPTPAPGLWNNVGVCCGSAGIADFLLELDRSDGSEAHLRLARALIEDLVERGTRDKHGLRWTHAEHRVRPELLTTQTGLMQGAAGIGLVLLHAHAKRQGRASLITLPDDPWDGL